MGTKLNPGEFDCYANAKPNEPIFVLLGRDRHAPSLVRAWAVMRANEGEDEAKVAEAFACADAMEAWQARSAPPTTRAGVPAAFYRPLPEDSQ